MNAIEKPIQGMMYDIQRYSLHDGPGIRTILFLKGCPLRCKWCANPESQQFEIAHTKLETIGYSMSSEEAVQYVKRDLAFFAKSGGGITLSGGELLAQPLFAKDIIKRAKHAGIHVAVETSCFAPWETFYQVTQEVDCILADIKCMDCEKHLLLTGVPNDNILENIKRAAAAGKTVIARVPVIPGQNDDLNNLEQTIQFCKQSHVLEVHLLPYHAMGVPKYKKLGRAYELHDVKAPDKEKLKHVAEVLMKQYDIPVKV